MKSVILNEQEPRKPMDRNALEMIESSRVDKKHNECLTF